MYILKFSENASKKFAGPPKFGQNPIGGSPVAPLIERTCMAHKIRYVQAMTLILGAIESARAKKYNF